jgi:putative phosphoesterase
MTKIIIISDVHFGAGSLKKIEKTILESDYCIFLGDGIGAVLNYKKRLGERLIMVKGNCDFSTYPEEVILEIDGHKILVTHGHNYRVKTGLDNLYYRAKELEADIALFGHTHTPYQESEDGILFVNPGSLGSPRLGEPTYAYMILSLNKKPLVKIVEVR